MPWNNQGGGNWQSGGGGNGRGPWGQGPQGGPPGGSGGGQTPDLEELIRRGQDRFKTVFPGGKGGASPALILLFLVIIVLGWMASGLYRVSVDEQGVVTRFGAFDRLETPGLRYHLPWPIEAVQTPKVTQQRSINVGFQELGAGRRRDAQEESLMLTGDENIVDIDFTVLWVINNAADFLFNVQNTETTVKAVAESVMREVVGRTNLQDILTQSRAQVQVEVKELMQSTLDDYGAGVTITEVQLQQVDPPDAVIEAFRDVQAARQDLERQRNEAEAYANQIIPEARGQAEQIIQQAEAYKQNAVAEAQGRAQRFLSIYNEYRQAPDVTRRRLFLETMEKVLRDMDKVVIDSDGNSQGVLPYLPLPELQQRRGAATPQNGGQ